MILKYTHKITQIFYNVLDTTATGDYMLESQQHLIGDFSNLKEHHSSDDAREERLFSSNSVDVSNGAFASSNHKIHKSPNNRKKLGMGTGTRTSRGRPRKALVAMYHSQISGDKNAIKIRIKKSNLTAQVQVGLHFLLLLISF